MALRRALAEFYRSQNLGKNRKKFCRTAQVYRQLEYLQKKHKKEKCRKDKYDKLSTQLINVPVFNTNNVFYSRSISFSIVAIIFVILIYCYGNINTIEFLLYFLVQWFNKRCVVFGSFFSIFLHMNCDICFIHSIRLV